MTRLLELSISESYVAVHWPWLILPALLLVMGIILLLCTIVVSKNQNQVSERHPFYPFCIMGWMII